MILACGDLSPLLVLGGLTPMSFNILVQGWSRQVATEQSGDRTALQREEHYVGSFKTES